jgi:hypothetical protein
MDNTRRPVLDLVSLPDTEEQFATWVRADPHGYVINAHRRHQIRMVWHRADCPTLNDPNSVYITGDFLKACSLNPGALAEWAKPRREPLEYCLACRDRWVRERDEALR